MTTPSEKTGCPFTRFGAWLRSVFFYEHWMVGVIDRPITSAPEWKEPPPINWIAPFDRRRYLADPFPVPGKPDELLCETYDIAKRLGRIATVKLKDGELVSEKEADIPLPKHLSFPFLFEDGGVTYVMPESCATGRLEIFRWDRQDGWRSAISIFSDVPVADAALYKKDGLYWISYTDVSHDAHDNLHLIYAPSLAGPWQAHPANPVQRGKDRSRNAGAVFEAKGKLYRPAQDCSHVYGGAIRLMEITEWTPASYVEKEAAYLAPNDDFYCDGFHTLTAWGESQCLTDGMRLVFSWSLLLEKILKRFGLR